MKFLASIILALVLPTAAYGQVGPDSWTPPLPTQAERNIADVASWVTVLATVALDAKDSWNSEYRLRAFALQGVRVGTTFAMASIIKTAFNRERPCHKLYPFSGATEAGICGIDDPYSSFYSAHTALAFSALGGPRVAIALPLSVTTAGLRVAAGKHWLTDTLVGAAVGAATSRISVIK